MMEKDAGIVVFGAHGMVGSGIVRRLRREGYTRLLEIGRDACDLMCQAAVTEWFSANRPDYVFLAAARVGGIIANSTFPAEFAYQNLMIQCNVIHSAHLYGVRKLLFLGSTCIYPKLAPQPIREDALLTSPLEPSNEAYALAKIAGLKMCEYYQQQYGDCFVSAMPTNLYGFGDNFHAQHSHVIPGMMRRFHEAKAQDLPEVVCWGTGTPLREFLFIEDLADGLVFLMNHFEGPGFVNIGTGIEVSIRALAEALARTVGYRGSLCWDASKPDGTPRKVADVSRLHDLGWRHTTSLADGLAQTYRWYLDHINELRC